MVHVLKVRNVCEALKEGVNYLIEEGHREQSRAGEVIVSPVPVLTVTERPQERVLFSAVRDANPFFHIREALWMLAGRDDVKSLTNFVKDFASYAEPGGEVHGAYGRRWRTGFGFDQLQHVVDVLRQDPTSRQCVIQMWDATALPWQKSTGHGNVEDDTLGYDDLRGNWKDRPCNTHIYLRVQQKTINHYHRIGGEQQLDSVTVIDRSLDMTVCCRSNDAVWGAHGANAVHFSVLQEYLAARIGIRVGKLYQLSNNYHIYETMLSRLRDRTTFLETTLEDDRYEAHSITPVPMFDYPDDIDEDIRKFEEWMDRDDVMFHVGNYKNSWFEKTLEMMMLAHRIWKNSKDVDRALLMTDDIYAYDWRVACMEWLFRRKACYN